MLDFPAELQQQQHNLLNSNEYDANRPRTSKEVSQEKYTYDNRENLIQSNPVEIILEKQAPSATNIQQATSILVSCEQPGEVVQQSSLIFQNGVLIPEFTEIQRELLNEQLRNVKKKLTFLFIIFSFILNLPLFFKHVQILSQISLFSYCSKDYQHVYHEGLNLLVYNVTK